jgi:hypothetical protein
MREHGGEADKARLLVDRRRLNGCDLMAAKRLAHDVEVGRECRIPKGLIMIARMGRADGRNKRLLWIGELCLRLGERGGDRPDRFARTLHGSPPSQGDRN